MLAGEHRGREKRRAFLHTSFVTSGALGWLLLVMDPGAGWELQTLRQLRSL